MRFLTSLPMTWWCWERFLPAVEMTARLIMSGFGVSGGEAAAYSPLSPPRCQSFRMERSGMRNPVIIYYLIFLMAVSE